MKCPKCGGTLFPFGDPYSNRDVSYRKRKCRQCGGEFLTVEQVTFREEDEMRYESLVRTKEERDRKSWEESEEIRKSYQSRWVNKENKNTHKGDNV